MFGVDELGMDLGTSTLHIVVRGKGIVLSEPAYVAYDRQTRNVVAVGEEARRMYGRTPAGLIVERPLRDGRIRSFDLVSKMLRYFMRKVIGKRATFRPKLLLALPGGMAPSERQTLVDVLVVGVGQAIATMPGISRSGMTITTGCFMGFERKFAVRFSFLLSIPAVLGANILSLKDAIEAGIVWAEVPMYLVGVVTAAVVGYACIRLLRMVAEKGRFGAFAYYCWAAGLLTLLLNAIK